MAESQPSEPTSPTLSTSSHSSSPKVYLTNGIKKKKKRRDLNGNPIVDRSNGEGSEIGLGDVDIEQNVYEGGFKSWEGAMDLARLVLERGPRKDIDELSRVESVVEVCNHIALFLPDDTNSLSSLAAAQHYPRSFFSSTHSPLTSLYTSHSATTMHPCCVLSLFQISF